MKKIVCAAVIFAGASSAFAADLSCGDVYANAVRNVELSTQNRTIKSFYFNLFCQKTGSTKEFTSSASFGFPIEGIPLEASGDGNWNESELKEFCKTGASNQFFESSDLTYGNFVVTDALASFNECRALEQKDVIITHAENPPSGVTIHGTIKNVQLNVDLLGVLYEDDKLSCTSTSFSEDGKAQPVNAGQAFKGVKGSFAIQCSRTPFPNSSGSYYPTTSLTAVTTEGPYTVRLRSDTNQGFNLASEAKVAYDAAVAARNNAIQQSNNLRNQVNSLNARIAGASVTFHIFGTGEYDKSWFRPRHDCRWAPGNDPNGHAKTLCGSDKAFIKNVGSWGGDYCGYNNYVVACVKQ